jgi:flavin-dependent dehydrogenase
MAQPVASVLGITYWSCVPFAWGARDAVKYRLRPSASTPQEARWLIDATGRSSAVSRQIGIKRSKGHRIVATYCEGIPTDDPRLNNIVIEAVRGGWWHATRLPSGASIVGIFTIPDIAVELHRDRKQWSDALVTTRHLREIVSGPDFNGVLHSHDASEGRLAIFQGEGWLACGDAAMSFDPIAGQGLHHAILNGAAVADAIRAANGTEPSSERSYSDGLEASWHTYRRRRIQTYRQERRWSRDPFWLKAHESPS